MGKAKIGGSIVLEGEKQYREALKGIKTEQAELRSEMKLCQNTFRESQNSLEALQKKQEIQVKQLDSVTEKQAVYNKAIEDYTAKQAKAAEKIGLLQTELSEAESKMKDMEGSSDTTKEALEKQAKAVEDLRKQLGNAEANYDSAGQKITSYQTALNYAELELAGMQKELDKTEAYIREAEEAADGCAESIDEYGRETVEAAEQTSVFGDVLKANLVSEAVISGIKNLANGIKTIAESAVESGASFEAAMSKTEALSGATGSELASLTAKAKEMGATTMFSASQSAEAFQYMALAGWKTGEMLEGIEPIMNLAAAADLDLAQASDIVTDYLTAFGLEAKDAGKFADQMAYAMASSNTSAEQLGEAYKGCAATAQSMGHSVEETTAILATMANAGVKGGEAGIALNAVMTRLATNTSECGDKLAEYGINIYNAQGEMNSLSSVLDGMARIWRDLTDQEQANIAKAIAGTNHYAKFQTLMAGCSEEAAKSGKSFNDYSAALETCDGAAKRMADTMQDNLKGKLTILQSALEGLGIASYECFDESLKEGVDGAAEAVGRLTRSVESGDLGISMRKLSKSFGELVEGAVDFGEDALPVVINGLTWVLDNSDLIASGVTGIVAANMQMKVVGPAINAVTAAWGAHKLATESAAVTQGVLNTAMSANPAGFLVTAIVGLTAAMVAFTIANKDSLNVMDDTTRATKELVENSRELNASYANSVANRQTAREGMENEAASCRKLVDELKDLQAKTDLTATEQARMQMIVDELNGAIPDLNLAIDEQTGLLNMSADALKNNVEAMMAMAKAEAAREDLTKIAEDQYEAEKQLADLEEQLEAQKQALVEAEKEYQAQLEYSTVLMDGNQNVINASATAYSEAKNAVDELNQQIDATNQSIEGFTAEYQETADYISSTEETYATAISATQELGDSAEGVGNQFSGMSASVQAALSEMQTSLTDTIAGQMDLFTKFRGEAELTKEELLENMQSQIDGISEWSENLALLGKSGIEEGLLKSLAEMGPEGASYVAAFVNMTTDELEKANELYIQSLSLPTEAAEKATEAYVEAGGMAAEGFMEGITESSEKVTEAAEQMAKDTLDIMKQALDIHSPSGETKIIGQYVDEGLESGMKEGKPNVIAVISDICSEIVRTSSVELQRSTFYEIGTQVTVGLEEGIRAGQSGVVSAITEMCTKAIETAKSTLKINSPSKQFEYMGEMSGEGYIEGWKRSMANIEAVIAASLPPDTSFGTREVYARMREAGENDAGYGYSGKNINVRQEINIYSQTDDLVETSRKFKESQQEAARGW